MASSWFDENANDPEVARFAGNDYLNTQVQAGGYDPTTDPPYAGYYAPPPPATAPPNAAPPPAPPPGTPQPPGTPSTQNNAGYTDQRPGLPNLGDFRSPDPLAPWTEQFTAPTGQEVMDSPGFQFNLGEGLKTLERSAAAKGTLLTGGTVKAADKYATDYANTKYGDYYNKAFNEYDTRRSNFLNNEAARYNSQRTNLTDQWGINSDYFNMGSALRQQDFNIFDTGRKFDFNVNDADRNFTRGLNQDYWQNQLGLAALGRPPAPNLG